jgi:hypothetical protein
MTKRLSAPRLACFFAGRPAIEQKRPAADEVLYQVETGTGVKRIIFDTEKLTGWDSSLLTFKVDNEYPYLF